MRLMVREIETKCRVTDAETLLAVLKGVGVAMSDPRFQDDQAYAPAGWDPEQGKVGFTPGRFWPQCTTDLQEPRAPSRARL